MWARALPKKSLPEFVCRCLLPTRRGGSFLCVQSAIWEDVLGAGRLRAPEFAPTAYAKRRARARDQFEAQGIAAALFPAGWARPRNFAHNVFPFRAESHFLWLVGKHLEGACLLFLEGKFVLYALPSDPEMELWVGPGKKLSRIEEELQLPVRTLDALSAPAQCACLPPQDDESASFVTEVLGRTIEAQSGGRLDGPDARLADAMVALRLAHDQRALEQLQFAATASARAHAIGMTVTRRCTWESEVRGAMEGYLTAMGLGTSYNSIVTTRGEILHAEKSELALGAGQLLLCDLGAESPEGFAADITRTWPVSGRFSPTQRDAYELVLRVQREAIEDARVGVKYSDLHLGALRAMARGLVDLGIARCSQEQCFESGLAGVFFPHGLGHLLGLDVHDMEDLGDRSGYGGEGDRDGHPAFSTLRLGRTLRRNMVVTIEPGFYQVPALIERMQRDETLRALVDQRRLNQFADVRGIRIEDDVWITDEGARVLSADAPKEVEDLEERLASS